MPRLKLFNLLLLLISIPVFLRAEILINVTATNPNARIFPLGNVDISQTGTIPSFYRFTIQNTGPDAERIKLVVAIELEGQQIARSESNEFELPVGGPIQITHQQINLGELVINDSQGKPQIISFVNSSYDIGAVSELEDVALRTGRLKSGLYTVVVNAVILSTGATSSGSFVLAITNPTSIYLLYPGATISDPEVKTINTLFPYLQWFSDADLFNIFVWDKKPEVNDVPILHVRNYTRKYLQYPSDTSPLKFSFGGESVGPVRLLEYGKTYYWLVEAVIPVVSGQPVVIKTDYFRFKVLEPGQSPHDVNQLWSMIEQLLGPENQKVLKQLKAQGFEPDSRIFEDDKPADIKTLIEYLNKIQEGKAKVVNANTY